jgi:L-arabinonolactonase
MSERVCCFAPRESGGLIVAYADRVVLFDPLTRKETLVAQFEPENPETRLNDGRTDRQGRFIVGGMNEVSGKSDSSVICVDLDLSVRTIISHVSCANSTCFSHDGTTMFFADTPDREIVAYDYDTHAGSVTNRRVHASFKEEPGLPDGSCVDAEGGVWNAEWEGSRVVRVASDGTIERIIDVPVWKPTCCAFGGPDLDTLFITTSRLMSDQTALIKEPESGGLFAVKPGIRGVIDTPFYG